MSNELTQQAFDALYAELKQYKENFLAEAERPLLLDLVLFYLDDGILCGNAAAAAQALQTLPSESARLGMHLNLSKCELVTPATDVPTSFRDLFPTALLEDATTHDNGALTSGCFDVLGAPVGSPEH